MIADLLLLAHALLFLAMGAILAALPAGTITALGLPASQPGFYRRLLGTTLIGIGLALMMNALPGGLSGLGLDGAIAVNLLVAVALAFLLLTGARKTPAQGKRLLWLLVLVLVGLSAADSLLT